MLLEQIIQPEFVTYKELILIVLASSGILTLVFTIVSKLFDKASRVIIMDEIKSIDEQYKRKVDDIERDVNKMRFNYLDRFATTQSLINENKEIAQAHHSETMQVLTAIKKDIEYLQTKNRS